MRSWLLGLGVSFAIAIGCSDQSIDATPTTTNLPRSDAGSWATDPGGAGDASTENTRDASTSRSNLRVVAGNISSGQASTYDSGEGIRLLQAIHPDVALIQELNYKTNS